MSLTTAARFARRELRGGLRGFRIFLACLALGVAAIAGIGMVRTSIALGLEEKGAELLGGDAELGQAKRRGQRDGPAPTRSKRAADERALKQDRQCEGRVPCGDQRNADL